MSRMIARLGTFQDRVLNGRGWRGPAFLVFLGVVPIVVALAIGAWDSCDAMEVYGNCPPPKREFMGYGHRPNWYLMPLILPIALLVVRQIMKQVANWRDDGLPLLQQFDEGKPREFVRDRLRAISTDHRVFLAAILVDVLIHIGTMWRVVARYFGDPKLPHFFDWCSYFLIRPPLLVPLSADPPGVTRLENALLVATAYPCTFAIVLLALLLVGIGFRANLLYLDLIYRRSGASASRDISTALVLDFNDPECCFGLRKLNAILNVQVRAAFLGGLFILIGRYAAVTVSHDKAMALLKGVGPALKGDFSAISGAWSNLGFAGLFPNTDQILLAVGWILGTAVVGMPALVKFLPLLTPEARNSRKEYLLQFIPPGSVPNEEDLDRETLDTWASGFATNSFWPTGDSRAFAWFMFVFAMLLIVLFPVRPVLSSGLIPYAAIVLAASSSIAGAFFWLLRRALWVVDSSLVRPM